MAIKRIAGPGGFAIRINMQHDSSDFPPISAVGFGIKKPPIRHQMLFVVHRENGIRRRYIGNVGI